MRLLVMTLGRMKTIRRISKGEWTLYREMRLAALADAPDAFSTTYESAAMRSQESWASQADASAEGSSRFTFFAFADEMPVGLAALYRDENIANRGELIQVWISPSQRGSGIADELIYFILRCAQENKFDAIFAEVIVTNARAIKFYRKHGFELNGSPPIHSHSSVVLSRKI